MGVAVLAEADDVRLAAPLRSSIVTTIQPLTPAALMLAQAGTLTLPFAGTGDEVAGRLRGSVGVERRRDAGLIAPPVNPS